MGEPVRIVDLATDLVRLSGFRPIVRAPGGSPEADDGDWDIEVVFAAIRPGEKLHEELFADGEECHPTRHEKILMAVNGPDRHSNPRFDVQMDRLADLAEIGDEAGVRRLLKEIVPEYRPAELEPAIEAGVADKAVDTQAQKEDTSAARSRVRTLAASRSLGR
jgi:FlaA1/EpsC-like NDP-sugar epimerase